MEEIKLLNENELEAVTGGALDPWNPEDQAVIIAQFAAAREEYAKLRCNPEYVKDKEPITEMVNCCHRVRNGDVYDYFERMHEVKDWINRTQYGADIPAWEIYNTYLEPLKR